MPGGGDKSGGGAGGPKPKFADHEKVKLLSDFSSLNMQINSHIFNLKEVLPKLNLCVRLCGYSDTLTEQNVTLSEDSQFKNVKGDHSGCDKTPVDIRTKVPF